MLSNRLMCPLLASLWLLPPICGVSAQDLSPQALGEPSARLGEPFTLIKGLRELSDRRVLVTDWIEQRLVVVDFERQATRDVGGKGSGPAEYRLPGELISMPGDSTLLIDFGNNRLSVIGPDLVFARSMSLNAHGERWAMNPRGVDRTGKLFFAVSPFALGGGHRSDSVPIAQWREDFAEVRHVPGAMIKVSTPRPPGRSTGPNIPYVVFAKQDGWAVASDGWIAVVRSDPYRVDWFGPSGVYVSGSPVVYRPIQASMQDRLDHVRAFLSSSMQSGRGEDGGMGLVSAEAQSDEAVSRMASIASFEDEFPPFVPGQVWVDGRGRVWVERAGPRYQQTTFDVFDRAGNRVAAYSLSGSRRVVGFGRDALYATVADPDDLLTLERYDIPR